MSTARYYANSISMFQSAKTALSAVRRDSIQQKDTGIAAYRMLFGAILAQSMILGFPLGFGVYQNYYDSWFPGNTKSSWIGLLSNGIPFLGAPIATYTCQNTSIHRQYYVVVGWAICVTALATSAFCSSLPALVVLQGVVYGVGVLFVEMPIVLILNTWFEKRRGVALGFLFAGADLVGVAFALIAGLFLRKYGFRTSTLALAASVFGISGPSIILLKDRVAEETSSATSLIDNPTDVVDHNADLQSLPIQPPKFYRLPVYYTLTMANLCQSLVYYLPYIYLPSVTTDLGCSSSKAAIVLAVANFAQIFGEIGFGQLSDMIPVNSLVVISSGVASLSTFLLWGFANSFIQLLAYGFIYGSFGSGLIALWARMGTLFGENSAAIVYSTMCMGRGIGSVVSGPVSSALLTLPASSHKVVHRPGHGRFGGVVLFVGTSTACSALFGMLGWLALWWKPLPTVQFDALQETEL